MRVLVTVECETSATKPGDWAYMVASLKGASYVPYDTTSVGREGKTEGVYSLRQVKVRSVRRARRRT